MADTNVVNLHHTSGRLPDGAVYVGRAGRGLAGSRWANRWRSGVDGTRSQVVRRFGVWLADDLDRVSQLRVELAGRTLACWCAPAPCHAHVLALVASGHSPAEAVEIVVGAEHPTLF